ncbi:MAG: hypothetical protein EXR59_01220 [Dehalococcoidia bacterium]|nr:hypothetical protein [Dehalococcoidia bacterium]
MPIKIGLMPYLNSVLFYRAMKPDKFNLVALPPRAMTQAAAEGKLDAGPIPVVGGMALERDFEPLGNFCIATKDKARSILLFSRVRIEKLDGKKVGVTDETSTSEQLLKVLLTHKFNLKNISYVSLESPNDAYLLIGDGALKNRSGVQGYPYMYDLGEVWNSWKGLSFVFAVWIVRKSLPQEQKDAMSAAIRASLNMPPDYKRFGTDRLGLNMNDSEVREYLEGFNFVMGEQEYKALKLFKSYLPVLSGNPQTQSPKIVR